MAWPLAKELVVEGRGDGSSVAVELVLPPADVAGTRERLRIPFTEGFAFVALSLAVTVSFVSTMDSIASSSCSAVNLWKS